MGYYCITSGKDNIIKRYSEVVYPHSLGLLYSTITAFLGFKPNEGEYKVMGLAPYGTHLFHHKKFDKLIKETEDGFELNMDYFIIITLIRLCLIRNYLNY